MVNLHKIMNAKFAAMIAIDKANREDRDVTKSDLNEAYELLKASDFTKREK